MQKDAKRSNIFINLAGLLLVLVFSTAFLMPDLYARYNSSSEGTGSARVASFMITTDIIDSANDFHQVLDIAICPGETKNYTISVTNGSEVAVDYTFTVKNKTENLPLDISISGGSENSDGSVSMSDSFSPSDGVHSYTLTVKWPLSNQDDYTLQGLPDQLVITIDCVQKN